MTSVNAVGGGKKIDSTFFPRQFSSFIIGVIVDSTVSTYIQPMGNNPSGSAQQSEEKQVYVKVPVIRYPVKEYSIVSGAFENVS